MTVDDLVPQLKRVVLRIESTDGRYQEFDYPRPAGLEVEHAEEPEWAPFEDGLSLRLAPAASAPLTVSVRFKANLDPAIRAKATMRIWSGAEPEAVLAAFAKATGWSYQEALDRAAAMTGTPGDGRN